MNGIQKTGLFLFGIALLLLLVVPSFNHYKLSPEIVYHDLGNVFTTDGTPYAEILDPHLKELYGKEYSSVYSFSRDYLNVFHQLNEAYRSNGEWHKVMHYSRVEMLCKHAAQGVLSANLLLWFFLTFVLGTIGALMYIFSSWFSLHKGIHHNGIYHSPATNRGWIGIIAGTFLILFYVVLYFYPEYLNGWMTLADPVKRIFTNHGEADQWFLYGLLYTLAMLVMGIRMLLKYRGNKYQQVRSASVMFFQLCFAFSIPEILGALNQPSADLKNIWPLNYSYFEGDKIDYFLGFGSVGTMMFIWGVVLFVIGVPVFTYIYGKRWYCSWVCGCGGLAETAGDPYRHLSSKKLSAWKIERWMIYAVLIFVVLMTMLVLFAYLGIGNTTEHHDAVFGISSGTVKMIYGFLIGSVFSGVVGTGFYPLLGNRVWCRYGCPLAAYMGIVQRFKSRFRITTNGGQCISCGNCSTYCEMGIDVRWYAQRGQNIVRSSCVGCGVCSAVCPRGVLKLENGPEEKRINDEPIIIGHDGIKLNDRVQ